MSRVSMNLFISLTIFLVSLATFTLADSCIVCKYDGLAYEVSNPSEAAKGLCTGVKIAMGVNCVDKGYNTHTKDTKYGGQKTFCRIKCNDPNTRCPTRFTDQPGRQPADGPHDALIGGIQMGCDQWPAY